MQLRIMRATTQIPAACRYSAKLVAGICLLSWLIMPAAESAARLGGARVWFKREDLCHTGAHKINNALGQALLAHEMGKGRVIAETGAGQHGVAVATVAALLGLECRIYMGAEDIRLQELNVVRTG